MSKKYKILKNLVKKGDMGERSERTLCLLFVLMTFQYSRLFCALNQKLFCE